MAKNDLTLENFTAILKRMEDRMPGSVELSEDEYFILYNYRKLPLWVKQVEDVGKKVSQQLKIKILNELLTIK